MAGSSRKGLIRTAQCDRRRNLGSKSRMSCLTSRRMKQEPSSRLGASIGLAISKRSGLTAWILIIGSLLACSSPPRLVDAARTSPSEGQLTFFVASSETGEALPGVDVMAVSGEGIIHLGRTEVGGSLTVDSTKLRLLRPHVIMFCHDLYYCGGLKTDLPNFFSFRELNISLAGVRFY